MIDPKVNGTRVVIGPCRLSFVSLLEKKTWQDDKDPKYSCTVLIDKSEKKTIAAIESAIAAAKAEGVKSKWNGKTPSKCDSPLRDGDDSQREENKGQYFINAKNSRKPQVVNKQREPITDPEEIYSGAWAYVSLGFYPYARSGNNGIGAAINSVMKFKDDERFGGGSSAEADFAGIDEDDDL